MLIGRPGPVGQTVMLIRIDETADGASHSSAGLPSFKKFK